MGGSCGGFILVMVDYNSQYFKTVILKMTTTACVVDTHEDMFTTHGLPVTFTSDNGLQFMF